MPQGCSHTPSSRLPSILLVEDSQTMAAAIRKYLADEYCLIHARDGVEAWEALSPDIELVITDIQMPRLTGQQLLVRIRKSKDPHISALPVIVITAADDAVDRNLAFLNGANDFITKPIDEMELQARVRVHHTLARTIRDLDASRRLLAEQATIDPLTKLKNRRALFDYGTQQIKQARRHGTELSIIVVDVDYFKKTNDTHGHQAGDQALIAVAQILTRMTRAPDMVARIGGEEFAILLPATNRLGCAILAERMRAAIENYRFMVNGGLSPLTASFGVAAYVPGMTPNMDHIIEIADRRLYLAKRNGRNRICVSDDGRSTFAI